MLIKLGDAWVDPQKVVAVTPASSVEHKPLANIHFRGGDYTALVNLSADDAAAAVNKALKRYDTVYLPASLTGVELAPALTDLERKVLLGARKQGMRWIARDITGRLFAYDRPPKKDGGIWNSRGADLSLDEDMFGFLHGEDKAPTSIGWLLRLEMGKW